MALTQSYAEFYCTASTRFRFITKYQGKTKNRPTPSLTGYGLRFNSHDNTK